jgi:hypothetical protein
MGRFGEAVTLAGQRARRAVLSETRKIPFATKVSVPARRPIASHRAPGGRGPLVVSQWTHRTTGGARGTGLRPIARSRISDEERLPLTGIECASGQFRSVHSGLSVCKHVQCVPGHTRDDRCGSGWCQRGARARY